jgi:hypothetical protein
VDQNAKSILFGQDAKTVVWFPVRNFPWL